MKAVVFGATGAVGRELVNALLASKCWESVTTIGRRRLDDGKPGGPPSDSKLNQVVVDMEQLAQSSEAAAACKGGDVCFITLGTTRKAAGSADAFVRLDRDIVVDAAKIAKDSGVRHLSLLTAQGSNSSVWGPRLGAFHGLLYMKTKGQAEDACRALGFEATSIFRPALIVRPEPRPFESIIAGVSKVFGQSTAAHTLANVMAADAEGRPRGTVVWELKDIKRAGASLERAQARGDGERE